MILLRGFQTKDEVLSRGIGKPIEIWWKGPLFSRLENIFIDETHSGPGEIGGGEIRGQGRGTVVAVTQYSENRE